jgi:PPOX class probable F420-dependent enzyme
MSHNLESLKDTMTILLTTYKRDGRPIATPVSIAFDGERAFFRSYDKAWKTKRLRNNPSVEIAPATLRGKPTGPTVRGRATLLSNDEAQVAANALAHRHRLLQGILVPITHRVMRYRTMYYELHEPGSQAGAG